MVKKSPFDKRKKTPQELLREKKFLERFFTTLGKHPEKATYGEEKTRNVRR